MIEQHYNELRYLQFEHFKQFKDITHGIFTRHGGYSEPPYQGLNTSTSIYVPGSDSVDNVARNRQLVLQALGISTSPFVTLWAIHSADVARVDRWSEWRTDWAYPSFHKPGWTPASVRKGDALITRERGLGIALSFADCTPILFYDPVEQVIGLAHAGWRGVARGIVLATVEAMQKQYGCLPANIYAGIGPAIGACCYEVGPEVQDFLLGERQFEDMPTEPRYREAVRESATFRLQPLAERESLHLDLWETNRKQLLLAGLRAEHIELASICTSCHKEHFFSYRGEKGKTGRFPVVLRLLG
ncbi:peptidoglycan editing factor PgeF [Ktedonosporobacter rubrisoli]|uniref:peptidoglycan editing factor PgeF n=1 Tax=Ktedonosporobacter rubrisoli TaxID=2509675 RepID=UPI0013EE439C|nr:peptidoglycan editing factor PgeF [Ktedonosporobacter rubrisoli]